MAVKWIGKKKKDKPYVQFVGLNADDVTGSAQIVSYKDNHVLLDFGLFQCSNKMRMYQMNSRNLGFSPKKITQIVVSHALHIDHYGLIPRLYKLGCRAMIYVPRDTIVFWKVLFKDNLKIQEKDIEYLKKTYQKNVEPLYSKEDVDLMMDHVVECDFDIEMSLNEHMSIRFRDAYHIINSAQIELFVNDGTVRKKVLYTGDLGNIEIKNKPFLRPFYKVDYADLVIGESTYATAKKQATNKARVKDIEKIDSIVNETCINKANGNVIFSSFAVQRTQDLLVELYKLYGHNENFKVPVVVDSPLACSVTKLFYNVLEEQDKELIEKVLQWKNLSLISEWKDSETVLYDKTPKIIISCSGFMEAGRIRNYLKIDLPNPNSVFVIIGYSSDDSLAGIIKSGKKKTVVIDDEEVKNKAKIVSLHSFSSHMQHDDLLKYYSDIKCQNIFLVHGDLKRRFDFAPILEKEYRKKCKTTKVWIGTRNEKFEF